MTEEAEDDGEAQMTEEEARTTEEAQMTLDDIFLFLDVTFSGRYTKGSKKMFNVEFVELY